MEQSAPRLRFPGFSGTWEKKVLGDLTKFQTGKSFSLELTNNGKYIVMDMGTIDQEGNRIESKTTNVTRDILKADDLVMPKDDIGGGLIIGRTAYIPTNSQYVLGDHVYQLRFHGIKGLFIHYQINSNHFRKQVKRLVTGSAQLGLNSKSLSKTIITIPSLPEQEKIADFFSTLDEKIDLKEKEIENVKTMKKGFLQKMFPQDGASVPRLRFPGFSGEWEKKKLGEIVQRKNKKGISDLQTPSVEYEDINAKEGTLNKNIYNKMIGKKGILFDKDDIVYGKLRPYLGNWINPTFKGVAVGDFWILKPKAKLAKVFLYYLIQGTEFQKIANQSIGTKMPRADWKLIANTVFAFPSIPEQEKIADFFSALDEKIDAMEKQLKDLKEMKKGFLQQMFI